jgi:hypothetical protein
VAAKCRAIVEALIGDAGFSVRDGIALQVVTARARGILERSASHGAFARAVLGNALSRHRLGNYFERVIFHAGAAPFLGQPFDRCGLQHIAITAANVTDALLASGTIPLVSTAVRDIDGAPAGSYWDGALVDYHLLIPYAATDGRVVLYPHFNDYVTPGWLDKHLPWRRAPRGHRWLDDVLLIAPSPRSSRHCPTASFPTAGTSIATRATTLSASGSGRAPSRNASDSPCRRSNGSCGPTRRCSSRSSDRA